MTRDDSLGVRARTRAVTRSRRARALLSLGVVLGLGAVGTAAYFTDDATLGTGSVASGVLDLELGPTTETFLLDGPGGSWHFAVVQLADVFPGESVAMDLFIKNGGTTPLTFTGEAWSTTNDLYRADGTGLLVSTRRGAVAGNSTGSTGYRSGTCAGGTEDWWVDHPISTTARVLTPSDASVSVGAGDAVRVCMLVRFPATAPSTLQQKTATLRATFDAVQP
ncbi:MAG: hypothetical protein EON53_03445 [Actinomycetales bacterium]|nr:MAG: hypothetical protein EON53_03445 [Actinomycetales bacterium]